MKAESFTWWVGGLFNCLATLQVASLLYIYWVSKFYTLRKKRKFKYLECWSEKRMKICMLGLPGFWGTWILKRWNKGNTWKRKDSSFNYFTVLLQGLPCHLEPMYWVLEVAGLCCRVKRWVHTLFLHWTQSSHLQGTWYVDSLVNQSLAQRMSCCPGIPAEFLYTPSWSRWVLISLMALASSPFFLAYVSLLW